MALTAASCARAAVACILAYGLVVTTAWWTADRTAKRVERRLLEQIATDLDWLRVRLAEPGDVLVITGGAAPLPDGTRVVVVEPGLTDKLVRPMTPGATSTHRVRSDLLRWGGDEGDDRR